MSLVQFNVVSTPTRILRGAFVVACFLAVIIGTISASLPLFIGGIAAACIYSLARGAFR